jgi:FKBP-type peptidyl-prolyl cis-trans isomerase FklB
MKNSLLITGVVVTMTLFQSCDESSKKQMDMTNENDKLSYSLGVNIGANMKAEGFSELNFDAFTQAIEDVYAEKALQLTEEEAGKIVQAYFQKKQEAQMEESVKAGKDFLAQNKMQEGVVELPSGLQYKVLVEGNGPKPTFESTVKTHYHGTLIDGTVFDSSVQRGEPISFPVGGVIRGWTEALQLMSVGSKWMLYIPSDLAYGPRGAGGVIGPNATLIFEVELLAIEN